MVLQIADVIILVPAIIRAIIHAVSEIDLREMLEVVGRLFLFGLGIFLPLLLIAPGVEHGINPLIGIAVIGSLMLLVIGWHWHASLNQRNLNTKACI